MSNFNQAALRSQVDQVKKEPLPLIEWQVFKSVDPGSEVIIRFGRGSRNHFRDVVHFWLTVLVYRSHHANFPDVETFLSNYLVDEYTHCQKISLERFHKLVQWYDFVESEHDFSPHGRFRGAWLVYEALEVALLAETDEEFVVFFWELYD